VTSTPATRRSGSGIAAFALFGSWAIALLVILVLR
jgi:hypothetical protein